MPICILLATPRQGAPCTLTTTGPTTVDAGAVFTLTLGATDTGDGLPTSWTINWGDGEIETFPGNPSSVTHIYDAPEPSLFTFNILASAACGGTTYFQNDLVVPSAGTDEVNWFAHDAVTNAAVTRAPVQSGPDAGLSFPLDAIVGPDGNLYVSGLTEGNVVRYDPSTGAFIDEFADGVPLTPSRSAAAGIAFGPDGHLYMAASDTSEVLRFNGATGAFIDVFVTAGSGGISDPEGLTFGPDGHLYVSDFTNDEVYRYDRNTGAFVDIFVTGANAARNPEDIVFGPDGNADGELDLYVASDRDHEVKRYQGPGGASPGAYIDDFVPSGSGGLENAQGVGFGPDGHFYVSSWKDDNVYRYDGATGAFIDEYVSAGLGGLNTAEFFDFLPGHQVRVRNVFSYFKPITVQRSRIPGGCGATLTDYPMLFSVNDPDLAHTSSGGDVTDLQGDDIVFRAFDDATCGGVGLAPCELDHEIEKYVSTTGEFVAWVRIPSVNTAAAGSDTTIVAYYGNGAVTSSTENPNAVWDTGFRGVWHLEEDVTDEQTTGTHVDSTSNGNDGVQNGNVEAAGKIADGQDFDGTADYVTIGNVIGGSNSVTFSAWVKHDNLTPVIERYVELSDVVVIRHDGVNSVGQLHFFLTTGGVPRHLRVNGALMNDVWYHVAGTWDGTTQRLFLNGTEVGTQTPGGSLDPILNGHISDNAGEDLDGVIDEVRISDTARSTCWLAAEHDNGNDPGDIGMPGFYIIGPASTTAVELTSFSGRALDGAVELEWETGSELDNLGFHLYRARSADGPWARVTTSLVPGLGSSPEGARYRYVDADVTNGVTYYYELEDVDATGQTERHGPVPATPSATAERADGDDVATRLVYGNPEQSELRIVPTKNGVVLRLDTGGFVAFARDDGTVTLEVPGLEDVAGASFPMKRAWVDALAGRDVKILSVRARKLERFDGLRPGGAPVSELQALEDGTVRARLLRRGRRLLKRRGAKLLETAYQGETKKALFELSPFEWDGSGIVLAKTLEVHIAFRGREPSYRVARHKRKTTLRLVTVEPGLYGFPLHEVLGTRRARFRLSRQGDDVAYHVEDDILYFWSSGADENPYGREAVYELELGVEGESMELSDVRSDAGWYWDELDHEDNRYYQAALVDAPDRWLGDFFLAPQGREYTFELHEPVSLPALLDVWLQGASDTAATDDHHVRVFVNGTYVTESRWGGKTSRALSVVLAPELLRRGDNTLEIESVADTDAPHSMVFLDRFRVRYRRATSVLQNARFVLDVTGKTPRWVPSREGFDPNRRYVATDVVHRPKVRSDVRTKLRQRRPVDYLVIGPTDFIKAARPLIRHRRRQGLRVATASTDAIASEFGYGELPPESIRDFIAYAYHNGRGRRLRYVLLLGDATYDFKDYLGTGVSNHVPPYMVRTSMLWTASDPSYAAVHGDDLLPDLAIGRLPAANVDDVRAMVSKIVAYETGNASMEAPVVLVSDNPDEAGNFPANADALAATVLANRSPRHISLDALGRADARQEIVDAFDEGSSLLSYVGHGGIGLWASENLFDIKSVDLLSPQTQQPILFTMNCLNGYFHFPFFNSLSEELLKVEGKGVVAAFSPSGLSLNEPAHRYHRALMHELFHGRHRRLGDAVLAAQEAYADTGALPELIGIYHLLGDPALTLR